MHVDGDEDRGHLRRMRRNSDGDGDGNAPASHSHSHSHPSNHHPSHGHHHHDHHSSHRHGHGEHEEDETMAPRGAGAGAGASSVPPPSSSSASASSSSIAAPPRLPSWLTHDAIRNGCRSVGCYRPIHAIDEGTYGKVWLAEDRETGERVALKQIKFDKIHTNEGFPVTALRETNVLLALRHPNIIRVREMVIGSSLDKVYMVMDFMPHNLRDFLERFPRGTFFTQSEVKCLVKQLLTGLAFMHEKWFVHRDLKTHNLLIDNEGTLVLCDFGLARRYGYPLRPYTETVVTLWYRAPELLLGTQTYGPAVDVWSVGCIFAEFLTKEALFKTQSESEAVKAIFRVLGTPSEEDWPGWKDMKNVRSLRAAERNYAPVPLRKALNLGNTAYAGGAFISDTGLSLLSGLLAVNPDRRLTAAEALTHPWFAESPPPADPRLLPAFPSAHDEATGAGAGSGHHHHHHHGHHHRH
jgi:cell division cycle 2-like protein